MLFIPYFAWVFISVLRSYACVLPGETKQILCDTLSPSPLFSSDSDEDPTYIPDSELSEDDEFKVSHSYTKNPILKFFIVYLYCRLFLKFLSKRMQFVTACLETKKLK